MNVLGEGVKGSGVRLCVIRWEDGGNGSAEIRALALVMVEVKACGRRSIQNMLDGGDGYQALLRMYSGTGV